MTKKNIFKKLFYDEWDDELLKLKNECTHLYTSNTEFDIWIVDHTQTVSLVEYDLSDDSNTKIIIPQMGLYEFKQQFKKQPRKYMAQYSCFEDGCWIMFATRKGFELHMEKVHHSQKSQKKYGSR